MPPRRERQSPDREDRDARRRGRQPGNLAGNAEMERQIRDLRARLEDMEATQRRGADAGEFSDPEVEEEAGHAEEEVSAEDASTERLIRAISRMSSKTKMDIPTYEGSLNAEELLDWIRAMDTYFDYEDIEEDKKIRHAVTKLKGHAALWWDELQADRRSKGKQKIKKLGSDDRQDEGEVHSEGLPDHSVQAHAKPETEVDDGEGVHRGVL
jgi:hypothetical protein